MNESTNNDERLILAIGRLERSLSRIETASSSLDSHDSGNNSQGHTSAELDNLKSRHTALRTAAENAIRQIDKLTGQD